MEVVEVVEETVLTIRDTYLTDNPSQHLHHLSADVAALWPKIDYLLYLPILGLTRPRDLYYYQGEGLEAIYGFTYKYLTLEHFLGQLTRVQVGGPLAQALATTYARAWYPGDGPLTVPSTSSGQASPTGTSSPIGPSPTATRGTWQCGGARCQVPSSSSSVVPMDGCWAAGITPSTAI